MKKHRFVYLLMSLMLLATSILGYSGPAVADNAVPLNSLSTGDTINFAGLTWVVLEPWSGYLLMQGDAQQGMPFDSDANVVVEDFVPSSPTNIAYWLNNNFYNEFSPRDQSMIQSHAWTAGPVGNNGSPDLESAHSVTCKIGLLSYDELSSFSNYIPQYNSWLRTAVYSQYAPHNQAWYGGMNGRLTPLPATTTQLSTMSNDPTEVDPTLYLSPNVMISGGNGGTLLYPPTVESVSPTSGGGGAQVNITGSGFTGASAVNFGNNAAEFKVNSDTSITAASPAGTGTVDITVTTPNGTSATGNADQFSYGTLKINPVIPFKFAPTVTGVSPTGGLTGGGTQVTIAGSGFTGATAVDFGNSAATNFKVNSDTSITATSPAGTGTVDVTVTTSNGTSAKSGADQFSYSLLNLSPVTPFKFAPTVTGVSPASGPATGGTTVTITGTNLTGATAVSFGSAVATGVSVNSSGTSITATSPAGTGTVDVTVTTQGGTSTKGNADEFIYTNPATPAPTVSGVSPASGPAAGGTQVTITGTNLTSGTIVSFGGTAATGVTVNSAASITATSPAGTGTVDVTVTTPGGTSATGNADQFTYTTVTSPPATGQTVMRFYIGNTDYYVNNQVQSMDTTPVIENERTLLPIRYVATPLGATVTWDQSAQKVTVSLGGKTIELWIGQNTAQVDGVPTPIDPDNPAVTPIILPPGRTMLPLRFVANNLGCQVDWDQSQQMVTVTYPGAVALNPQPLPPG